MISIVDYGMGNLRSVQKGFEKIGVDATIVADAAAIAAADRLVLPGVGAFCDAIDHLRTQHLIEPIRRFIESERPFLGICLGLQLLLEQSFEDGQHDGLGIFAGAVRRFDVPRPLKVPHMGWNALNIVGDPGLFAGIEPGAMVYFVHSYYADPANRDIVSAYADYPTPFAAALRRDNVHAVQFHPEKSQQVGLRILSNFAAV